MHNLYTSYEFFQLEAGSKNTDERHISRFYILDIYYLSLPYSINVTLNLYYDILLHNTGLYIEIMDHAYSISMAQYNTAVY